MKNKYSDLGEDDMVSITIHGQKYTTKLPLTFREKSVYQVPDLGRLESFISGLICEIFVKEGDVVQKGQKLLILEAMKMKNVLLAPISGTVCSIEISAGNRAAKGDLLIQITSDLPVAKVEKEECGPSSAFTDDQ